MYIRLPILKMGQKQRGLSGEKTEERVGIPIKNQQHLINSDDKT